MNFKILKDTNKKFILRITIGSLYPFYLAIALLSGLAILSASVGVSSVFMNNTSEVEGVMIFASIFLVVAWCFIDWKFIKMGLKSINMLTIDRINDFLEIKNVLPRKISKFTLVDIEKFVVTIDDKDNMPPWFTPMRLEVILKTGQREIVYKTYLYKSRETMDAILHVIDAALHKEIAYDGNSR